MHDGTFDPGDFSLFKGHLPDASPAEKAVWRSVEDYGKRCQQALGEETRSALHAEGADTSHMIFHAVYAGDSLCARVWSTSSVVQGKSWPEFLRHYHEAKTVFDSYAAATLAGADTFALPSRTQSPIEPQERFVAALDSALVADQAWRKAMDELGHFTTEAGHLPMMSPEARAVLLSLVIDALSLTDRHNTQWLKGFVAAHGWPSRSVYGAVVAHHAWLIAQHADADPVFQYRVSRLMASLVARHEASGGDFAYLTDRVQLAIGAPQTYATQFACIDHRFQPRNLADPSHVDERRGQAGLEPLKLYARNFPPRCD